MIVFTSPPEPLITDSIERWFSDRIARVLSEHSIRTLADLTVRIPRLRGWWRSIPGLGQRSATQIEAFFSANPGLTKRARALVRIDQEDLIPWERLKVPDELNGTRGAFRAHSCAILCVATTCPPFLCSVGIGHVSRSAQGR